MKRLEKSINNYIIAVFIVLGLGCHSQSQTKDIDSNTYDIVNINNQTWMATNLNVSRFKNGDSIAEAKNVIEWGRAYQKREPMWCYYDYDPENGKKYGKLYNYWAVVDIRGLAPDGWRIPLESDWTELINNLGGNNIAGIKMKSKSGWDDYGDGNNESGFSALPGGYFYPQLGFFNIGKEGYWQSNAGIAQVHGHILRSDNSEVFKLSRETYMFGTSIRCIKN